mgnify:CR=1 FL=1
MTQFDESKHNRHSDGKFANKPHAEADDVALAPGGYDPKAPATVDRLQKFMEDNDLLHGNADDVHPQGNDIYITTEAPNNSTMGFTVPQTATMGEAVKTIIEHMDTFDADEEFNELASPGTPWYDRMGPARFLDALKEDEQFYLAKADELRGHKPWRAGAAQPWLEVANDLETDDMPDVDAPVTQENLEAFLEAGGLQYGNAEISVYPDGSPYVSIEGPNHATLTVNVVDAEDTMGDVYAEAANRMEDFDPEEEFNELWSRQFGEHNHYTPSQFLAMLNADAEFFEERGDELRSLI